MAEAAGLRQSVPLGQEWLLKDEVAEDNSQDKGNEESPEGLSTLSAVVMNVNMVIGAGVVGLPYAFYHAGALISISALLIATLMASASMGYLVEVMAWCEAKVEEDERLQQEAAEVRVENEQGAEGGGQEGADGAGEQAEPDTAAAKQTEAAARAEGEEEEAARHAGGEAEGDGGDGGDGGAGAGAGARCEEVLVFKGRKLEISEMCGLMFPCKVADDSLLRPLADSHGRLQLVRRCLELALLSYTFGTCWLYSTVFASSLSLVVPLPLAGKPTALANCLIQCTARASEDLCSAPCAWDNATSSCLGLPGVDEYCEESYQTFLVLYAVLMLSLACFDMNGLKNLQLGMGALALASLLTMVATCVVAIYHDKGTMSGADRMPPTNLNGMGKLITAAIFSQICHQATPSIVSNMREKRKAKLVFRCTLYYTFTLYVLLCLVTTYFFGDKTVPIITLNWEDYSGGSAPGVPISWWASLISTSVLVFPVVSVSAAYPLNVIPLAATIQNMLFPSPQVGSSGSSMLLLRVTLSLLPILCAAVVKDVSKILEFNGMFGFVLAFFVPCSLYITARAYASKRWGPRAVRNGHWSWPASTMWCVWGVLFTSIVVASYTLYQVVLDYAGLQPRR